VKSLIRIHIKVKIQELQMQKNLDVEDRGLSRWTPGGSEYQSGRRLEALWWGAGSGSALHWKARSGSEHLN
jgi:hypothetical protein